MNKINHKENPRLKYLVLIGPAIGLLFLVIGIILIRNDVVARNWADVSAIVSSSKMKIDETSSSTTDGSTSTFYNAEIKYNYNYKGQEYTGNDNISNSVKIKTIKIINKYPANSAIEIKVNPEKPAKSRLLIDIHPYSVGHLFALILGAILTTVFTYLAYLILFRRK